MKLPDELSREDLYEEADAIGPVPLFALEEALVVSSEFAFQDGRLVGRNWNNRSGEHWGMAGIAPWDPPGARPEFWHPYPRFVIHRKLEAYEQAA